MVERVADRQWAKWSNYFDDVERGIYLLFHTRHMWRTINGLLDVSDVEQYPVVRNHLNGTYITTVCTGIRREADDDTQTSSLLRCLRLLKKSPEGVTRQRFVEGYCAVPGFESAERKAHKAFNAFAPNGGDTVEHAIVDASIDRLIDAAKQVKQYTDEVLAHRQYSEPVDLTLDEIDRAFEELGAITKQYYGLRHSGQMLARLTPVVGREYLAMFTKPWLPKGTMLPAIGEDD